MLTYMAQKCFFPQAGSQNKVTGFRPHATLRTSNEGDTDMAAQTFDDRDGWIWMNGKLVPWREAKIHVLTHALHYASAVFEASGLTAARSTNCASIISG